MTASSSRTSVLLQCRSIKIINDWQESFFVDFASVDSQLRHTYSLFIISLTRSGFNKSCLIFFIVGYLFVVGFYLHFLDITIKKVEIRNLQQMIG